MTLAKNGNADVFLKGCIDRSDEDDPCKSSRMMSLRGPGCKQRHLTSFKDRRYKKEVIKARACVQHRVQFTKKQYQNKSCWALAVAQYLMPLLKLPLWCYSFHFCSTCLLRMLPEEALMRSSWLIYILWFYFAVAGITSLQTKTLHQETTTY